MTVLTATSAVRLGCLSGQRSLPWGPVLAPAPRLTAIAKSAGIKPLHGTGSAGPSQEPPRGVAKARSDKPGGT